MSDTPIPDTRTPRVKAPSPAPRAVAPDSVPFDAFSMPQSVRDVAESGLSRMRDSYETAKTIANDSSAMVESTFDAVSRNAIEINRSALQAAKTSLVNGFDHVEALMGVRTIAEAIELQTDFLRRQFEQVSGQARAFQTRIGKAVEDTAAPARDGLDKTLAAIRAAV